MTALRRSLLCWLYLAAGASATAQGFHEREPTNYPRTDDDNTVTALNRRLAAGTTSLPATGRSGRLGPLLRELGIPASSQTLVFAKTSLQRQRISPRNPRALYFGPDAYVGWVPDSPTIEVAAGDPRLGLVFYTLSQDPKAPPELRRDDSCLGCHASSRTDDEPGLLLRSVFVDAAGEPILPAGETRVTLRTPMDERWGGWLVTGDFAPPHRGNGIATQDARGAWCVAPRPAKDLGSFAADFATDDYPVQTSDIGALLCLEQQVTVHNVLVRAALQMRHVLDLEQRLNEALDEHGRREATTRIADRLAREIAPTLLFADEAPLQDRAAAADPRFAAEFHALWPADSTGLRLGQLDLRERVFVLPMSPMVHSPAFAALPDLLRTAVHQRLRVALQRGRLPVGVRLTALQRDQLHAHLRATLAGY